jgi:hypothetical protein
VAASSLYEAYPSIAYDPSGTLWIAYEEGAERWGKDYGADESSGVPIYAGRAIRVRGFAKDGSVIEPGADVGEALPGQPGDPALELVSQARSDDWQKAQPDAEKRGPNFATAVRLTPAVDHAIRWPG